MLVVTFGFDSDTTSCIVHLDLELPYVPGTSTAGRSTAAAGNRPFRPSPFRFGVSAGFAS